MKTNEQTCIHCNKNSKPSILCPSCGKVPKNMELWPTVLEALNNIEKLMKKINKIRAVLNHLGITSGDNIFLQLVNGWNADSLTTHIQLKLLEENKELLERRTRGACPNCSNEEIQELLFNFEKIPRKVYLLDCMFQFESFLNKINKTLPNPYNSTGYEGLANHVIRELGLSKVDNEISKIFCFPAFVRNTMHSDGIHTHKKEPTGKIKGINFEFKKDTFPYYASWRHIYFFFDNILEGIELMIQKNPKNILKISLSEPKLE